MKERPILFSTEMVKAILEGRKTQTRRIVKKQPHGAGEWARQLASWLFPNVNPYIKLKCPYGQPGDRLWVRETFLIEHSCHKNFYEYRADYSDTIALDVIWRPSIFMPREACRLMLEVTDVRVERLQDITEEDAIAEGTVRIHRYKTMVWEYETLWESINGKGSWDKNPWVWVIEFKKIEP
jgi:hypothetical protein